MPFDAPSALGRDVIKTPLEYALESCGLLSVPDEFLAAHKADQVQKHGPSFWYRHQKMLPTALLGSVAGMAASGGLAQQFAGSPWLSVLTFGWLCVIATLIGVGMFRVSAGSHWEERSVVIMDMAALGAPKRIIDVARTALRATPGGTLILGELIQEEVVLDPYLLLERDGEVVCIGIWEDDHIYACADEYNA